MRVDSRFAKPRNSLQGRRDVTFCGVQKVTQKARARTCKKLPVASFCTSETAETGRIANGCEQGDHVSRRKGAIARAACYPDRGKLSMQWKAPERETKCYFLRRAKSNTKSTRGKPCDPGSNRRSIRCFEKMTGFYQVTGFAQPLFRTVSTAMI